MLQDTRQIEQVKGRLTFSAFAMTYCAGNQFQMNRAFVFALMSAIRMDIGDYPFG